MADLYKPAFERYSPADKARWPVIITNIVSAVSTVNHQLSSDSSADAPAKLAEGKEIVAKLSALKHNMGRNGVLEPIPDDGNANRACYNDELAALADDDKRWFTANWLFAECYLYRLLRSYFALTAHWKSYDPFFESKAETYKSSSGAILHLAHALNSMVESKDLQQGFEKEGSALEIAFWEMVQADLWGNATDLSLLTDLKYEDLQKLQAVGAAAQAEQAEKILRNDLPKVWELLKTLKDGRVDIVMDNAGFELYTDFIFADFLLSCTPFVKEVVFHPKTIPWFVSDVLPYDFEWAIESLFDTSFFASHAALKDGDTEALSALAARWKAHSTSGRFRLSVPTSTPLGADVPAANFWTTQYAYQDLPAVDPALLAELQKSDLVMFKGDLNYRKLIGDAKWPVTTPFSEALGPLAGKFNLLSLRTNKADTICGLPDGVEARLDKDAPDWRVSGKYAVVSFEPKA
ncbi:Hairy/enhancer-of-split with YRPW motif protein 2 [Vanrija albida]|uniref:Sugar phosphate phosphatase n=1 Tax=Vanrija albida TaxID=181172 RepID=A0ABR3Q0V8_9TREE